MHSVRPIGAIFITVVLAYFLVAVFQCRPMRIRGWELPVPSVGVSLGQVAVSSLDWLIAAAVCYVLLPADMSVSAARFLGVFLLAQTVGLLSHVPGGLGIFEGLLLLCLVPTAQAPALVGSLLLYRLIYYILPLMVGSALLAVHELIPHVHRLRRLGEAMGEWGSAAVPQAFAFTTMVAGGILLFSGALPAVQGRMGLLRRLLPLPAVELSHFLGSLTGAGLLILSRGLLRRLDSAFHLTVLLLGLGIAFSLLKGLDYEEAVTLAIMLGALLSCRPHFHRTGSLWAQRFTPAWTALVAMILVSVVWLGLFSHKHVEYSHDLWWQFAFRADAPRFLRATAGAVALVLLYSLARLLVPRGPLPPPADADAVDRVEPVVRASRRTYAHLALLGDKAFVTNETQTAFIMYAVEGRSWVAMGDPIGPEDQWEDLVWRFVERVDRNGGWPVFYQVDAQSLSLYTDLGLSFIKLGEEARVSLTDFDLEGRARKGLRHSHNKLTQLGCSVEVIPSHKVAEIIPELRRISDRWIQQKNTREKRFSLGFFDSAYLVRCPVAVVRCQDGIRAFANLWTGADKEEISVDLMRYEPDGPEGMMDYLFVDLMLWARDRGYRWFNLGMAPLSGLQDRALAPLWSKAGAILFHHGEHFYNFQGLRAYKEKFGPTWGAKYMVCPGGMALPRIVGHVVALTSGGLRGVLTK